MLNEKENQIIELIYEAALHPDLLKQVLKEIADYTHSSSAIYTYLDQLNSQQNFVITHNIPEEGLANYHQKQLDIIDMKLHGEKMKSVGVGRSYSVDSAPYAKKPNSDEKKFYEHCLKPSNIRYLNGVLLDYGAYKWAMFAIHRSDELQVYTTEDKKILERFAKHLRRSLQIYRQMIEMQQENKSIHQILEKFKIGVILLNERMQIQFSNHAAEKIFNSTKMIWIDTKQGLKTLASYQTKMDQLVASILAPSLQSSSDKESGGVLCIQHGSEPPLMLTIVPLGKIAGCELIHLNKTVGIFMTQLNSQYILSAKVMKEIYSLSPREIQICELFLNGLDLNGISIHCGITLSSLRTYLKTIFSKTGCNSQVDLLRLLVGLTLKFEHIE